jgi:hypothetical protein
MPYEYDPPDKFGYKDLLPEGDPEKLIKGTEFDDEFNKIADYTGQLEQDLHQISVEAGGIEEAPFDQIAYARQQGDWTPIDVALETPSYAGAYVRKDITENQQVISTEFTFAFDGGVPLTMKNTGMYVNADYIRHNATEWEVSPSLNVLGDITAGGDLTVNGESQLNGNLSVDGTIDATGDISTDANLNITGDITGTGNLTLNGGNIIIDGGGIVDPDGNPSGGNYYFKDESLIPDAHNTYAIGEDGSRFTTGHFSQQVYAFGGNSDLWNTAYQWGDHSAAGYSKFSGSYNDLTNKPSLYDGSDAVKTSGNQTVGGIKTFSSDIRAKANVYAYYGSDERLKDDISPMPVGLIDAVEPCTWKWKEDGRSSGGVIAQQLQQIGLDDWVREAPNGDLGVDYNALLGMLICEVRELKRRLGDADR